MGARGRRGSPGRTRFGHEGQFCEAARGDDYFGVQAYTRIRLDEHGMPTGPEPGVELLDMGYEYWPQGLEVADPLRGRDGGSRCT